MYNKAIENTIIASMMIIEKAYNQGVEELIEDMIYNQDNKTIFKTLKERKKFEVVYDACIMGKETKANTDYISFLLSEATTTINIKKHIKILRNDFLKRSMMVHIFECKALLEEDDSQYQDAQKKLENAMTGLLKHKTVASHINHISEDLGEFYEYMEAKNDKYLPTPTGFAELDKKLGGGFMGGENVIIAGRPGSGKTNLALKLAMNTSKQGKKVLIFSYEMRKRQIIARYLAAEGRINNNNIRRRNLGEKEMVRMSKASNVIHDSNIYLCSEYLDVDDLCMHVRAFKRKHPDLDMIVVDYLQIIPHSKGLKLDPRGSMTHISKSLTELSKELNIKNISLSQLTRPSGNRKKRGWPFMTDLKESSQIEQDANVILLLYCGYSYDEIDDFGVKYTSDQIDIIIEKAREGDTGVINCLFEGEYNNISDYPSDYVRVEVVDRESDMTKGISF